MKAQGNNIERENQNQQNGFFYKYITCCFSSKRQNTRKNQDLSAFKQPKINESAVNNFDSRSKVKNEPYSKSNLKNQSDIKSSLKEKKQIKRAAKDILPKSIKIFNVNGQQTKQTKAQIILFRAVKAPKFKDQGQKTKPQTYAIENNDVRISQKINDISLLNFTLDQSPGVSDTFTIPYFDYSGIKTENRQFSNLRFHQEQQSALSLIK